ncbi:MAG: InlB B-repeat-containing protein [Oscillospiraceae bacterium]|nr:InlB B-repeat-containing protein [Oscillospiraceae bacterium]
MWHNIIPWVAWAFVVLAVVSVTCVLAWRKVFEDRAKYVPVVGGMYFEDSPGEITPYDRDKTLGGGGSGGGVSGGAPDSGGQYELRFSDVNGEDALPPVYVPANTTVTLEPLGDRGDSVFSGWYADRGLTVRVTEVTMDSGKIVYAGWAEKAKEPRHMPYLLAGKDGFWRPDGALTRGDMAVLFSLMVGVGDETGSGAVNASVPGGGVVYAAVLNAMLSAGIIHSLPEGEESADEPVSRAEFIEVCARVARLRDAKTEYKRPEPGTYIPAAGEDHRAAAEIALAGKWGWLDYMEIPGAGEFPLDGDITRAEVAYIVNRLLYRDCDEVYVDARGLSWRDVPEDHWARYDIMESSVDHSYSGFKEKERWLRVYG